MINTHAKRWSALLIVVPCALMGTLVPLSGAVRQDRLVTLSVSDARPIAEAVLELERRHGWVVTYEDPPYLHPSEIVDVTRAVRKDYDPSKPRVLAPRGGAFDFAYRIPAGARDPDPTEVLENLLREYRSTGLPGVFRLTRTASVFHVIPSGCKNSAGQIESCVSFLETKITLPDEERTALQMLERVTRAVGAATHEQVGPGTVPLNLLIQTRIRGGANNETARAVVLRTLEATKRKLSWKFLCDPPGPNHGCALNVHFVGDGSGTK